MADGGIDNGLFPPLQRKILDILADGRPHKRGELLECFEDPLVDRKRLNSTLSVMRSKMRIAGHDIICELKERSIHYRHVRLLAVDGE